MSKNNNTWQHNSDDYGFRVKVPQALLQTFDPNDKTNPLTKQFIPHPDESIPTGQIDPLQEHKLVNDGIIQKYNHRILITTTGACAVHCRYCFRRHFPYENNSILQSLDKLVAFLNDHPDIYEVILSGGDPLMLKNHQIEKILLAIKPISSVTTIRLHTRMPAVTPARIDDGLCQLIKQHDQWQWVVVTHINHADELNELNKQAFSKLKNIQVTLLNQSVLLKGINDQSDILEELSIKLFEHGILPYYLHQLDPVKGAMHFEVDLDVGKYLIKSLQSQLPGYLVPKFVQEQPGQPNKTTI